MRLYKDSMVSKVKLKQLQSLLEKAILYAKPNQASNTKHHA